MTNIKDIWPFPYPPRDAQVAALEWAVEQDAKYLILEAPVGSGKSNIGVALSRYWGSRRKEGDSYILTPQRILQKQYEDSFKDEAKVALTALYGKSNYTCQNRGTTCDVGALVKPRCDNCPYSAAWKRAKGFPNTVMNYKLGLILFAYAETFEPRELLVLDECHTLEQHLIDFDLVVASDWRAKKFGINWEHKDTFDEAVKWFESPYLEKAHETLSQLYTEVEPLLSKHDVDLSRKQIKQLKEFAKLEDYVDSLEMFLSEVKRDPDIKNKWVLVHEPASMTFKRLYGSHSFHNIVKPIANRFLFMSSTVLNKFGFCKDLGIDPKDAAFLTLDSDFPVENRTVAYAPVMKMNAKWKDDDNENSRQRMIDEIIKIAKNHDGESGIIHTGNFAIAKWLVAELEDEISQKIYHHNPDSGDDRNAVITAFMDSPKPGILISPSSTEGLDLKEDLSRFAIFCKIPFGYLGDQWIRRRMEMSKEWYQRRAIIDVIQGGGRIVRGTEDVGTVYILDASWSYLFSQTDHMIPQWWKDAYIKL